MCPSLIWTVSPGSPITLLTYNLEEPIESGSNAMQSKRLGPFILMENYLRMILLIHIL